LNPRFRFVLAFLVTVVFALASYAAHATGSTHHNSTTGDVTATGGSARSDASANAGAVAGAQSQSGSKSDASAVSKDGDVNATALSLALSGCQAGAGGSGAGFGASIGSESRVCQLLRVAAAQQALGMHYEASVTVRQALYELNGGGSRPEEGGYLFRAARFLKIQVISPIFSLIPFVGHGA